MAFFERLFRNSWAVDDDRWYTNIWRNLQTHSGSTVDEGRALGVAAVWACIKILSEDIGSLPLHLYVRMRRGKDKAVNHPFYTLLHDRPNPEMSAMSFRETAASHVLAWGNFYAEKEMDQVNQLKALWPIPPNRVIPFRDHGDYQIKYRVNLSPAYKHGEDDPLFKIIPRERMLHIPGLSFNGLVGYSPIGMMREAIGMAQALEEFGARFFGSGTHPGAVVSHPGKLGPQAHKNLEDSLTQGYSGLGKSHRLLLLEEGMKLEKIGIPPNEAQFIDSRRFQLAEIARIYRMPLSKLGDYEKGVAYRSVEMFNIDYVVGTLRPWLERFEQGYNWQLLPNDLQRRRYFWKHAIEGLLRGDFKSRYQGYWQGRQGGWLSPNDIRELEDMNYISAEKGGDDFLIPNNMIVAGQPPPEPPGIEPQPVTPEPDKSTMDFWRAFAHQDLFRDALEQILSREANGLRRLVSKANGNWAELLEDYYSQDLEEFISKKITPAIRNFIYQNLDHPEDSLIQDEVWFFIQEHISKSKNYLAVVPENFREKALNGFSSRAADLAVQAMAEIKERIGDVS